MKASVDRRSIEREDSPRREIELDPDICEALGVSVGDVVEMATGMGRHTVVRLLDPPEHLRGSGLVRLDRFMRMGLKAQLDEHVDIRSVAEPPHAVDVTLAGPTDVSRAHAYREQVAETLRTHRTPLSLGSKIYFPLAKGPGGMVFEVVELKPGPSVVSGEVSLRFEPPEARKSEGQYDTTFEDIGGLGDEIRLIREMLQLPLQMPFVYRELGIARPRGVLLHGPPGCGKTEIARALANEIGAKFYFINGPSLVGTMQGETESNLRRIFSEAAHHAPAVVVIDELDAVAPHRDQSGSQSNIRAVTAILSMMDGLQDIDGVVVMGTTNRLGSIDSALRRPGRFDQEIYVGPPKVAGRREILEIHTREMPLTEKAHQHLDVVAERSHGFAGADLRALCREAGLSALREAGHGLINHADAFAIKEDLRVEIRPEDFDEALRRIEPSAAREVDQLSVDVDWDDIGGLDAVKHRVHRLARLVLEQRSGLSLATLPMGILLYGPPGVGKTMMAHALAKDLGVSFLAVDGPSVFSRWLGESEATVRHLFELARQLAPTILLLDQLDALAPIRGADTTSATTERVVSQLIGQLDASHQRGDVLVIATSNRPELVDPAVLRSGRIGLHLGIPLPDPAARREIVALHYARLGLIGVSSDEAIDALVEESEGMAAGDIRQAAELALTDRILEKGADVPEGGDVSIAALLHTLRTVRATSGSNLDRFG